MKRILALIYRDLLSTSKDQFMIYAVLAPVILALGLRFFLPVVGQTTVNVVVTRDMPPQLVERMQPYLNVEVVPDRAALERRVLAMDDAVGIVSAGDGYAVILEGNEAHDSVEMPGIVLQRVLGGDAMQVATVDVAGPQFPFRELIGAFTAVGVFFLAGTVMALHIVEDKESRIMQALGVSPMGRLEYVAARSLLVVLLSVAMMSISLWLLGITEFDYLQMLTATVVGSLAAVLVGFIVGAISSNQIAAVANIKFGSLAVLMPAFLTLLVPEGYQVMLYWSPSFWTFVAFKGILLEGANWATLTPVLLWNLAVSLVFAALCYSWLKGKLDFARN